MKKFICTAILFTSFFSLLGTKSSTQIPSSTTQPHYTILSELEYH